ncbi:unnamed protein product, partial [Phaeothamnion confervicola]
GKNVIDLSCGAYHTLALSEDGRVYPFGRNNHGQLGTGNTVDALRPCVVEALVGQLVCHVAAGFYHSLAVVGPPLCSAGRVANTLRSDLRKLLNNPARSDVTFRIGSRIIHGHRCVLMARCEPLDRMLDGPMREASEREVAVGDCSYEVFLALLEYLYTEEVTILDTGAVDLGFLFELLGLADQYLLEALKERCEAAIQRGITTENAGEMLLAA